MIGHIQELTMSKEAWETLERLYTSNTKPRKIQLKNELNNMKKTSSISVNDYILKIKEISDALGSIGAQVEDDDLVSAALYGLKDKESWKSFSTSVYVHENFQDFEQLKALMIIEERNIGGLSSARGSQDSVQAFYSDSNKSRGCGYRRAYGGGRSSGQFQNLQNNQVAKNSSHGQGRRNIKAMGSSRGRGGWQQARQNMW